MAFLDRILIKLNILSMLYSALVYPLRRPFQIRPLIVTAVSNRHYACLKSKPKYWMSLDSFKVNGLSLSNEFRLQKVLYSAPSSTFSRQSIHSRKAFLGSFLAFSSIISSSTPKAFASTVSVGSLLSTSSDEEVVKRPSDDRKYKAITLNNGMRVLLISDPSTVRSAAAIDVHVGSFSDYTDLPGTAHFTEHMSFLGTEKYPNEDDYSNFLASHGGSSNAYTDTENTVYYFDVNANNFEEALDRFSQFFIAPLFTQSATDRELNAIDSEHAKNINSDAFRLYQLDKDFANPLHPLNKFATGNKDTLDKPYNRQRLLEFHSKYYSANQMTLAVIGKEDLSTLEAWTTKHFMPVQNKGTANPSLQYWGRIRPYLPQKVASLWEVVPIGQKRSLAVSFPIWVKSVEERKPLMQSKPDMLLSNLIGHESAGSLRAYLVKKGWVNAVSAYVSYDISDLDNFAVKFDLTEEGLRHRNEIIASLFGYIDILKKSIFSATGLPEYITSELQQLTVVDYVYSEKSDPADFVSGIVSTMQSYDSPKNYLIGPRIFTACDTDVLKQYVGEFKPENARIQVIAQEFQGKTTSVAPIYNTSYNFRNLTSETTLFAAASASDYPTLHLPEPNPYLPSNFDLIVPVDVQRRKDLSTKTRDENPSLLVKNQRWSVWHKLDGHFQQPKAYLVILLAIPDTVNTIDFYIHALLFSMCLNEALNEFLYQPKLAGLDFNLDVGSKGISLVFSGFNDKLPLFTKSVLDRLKTFNIDAMTFSRTKDIFRRDLDGWKTQQPYSHASYYANRATETQRYRIEDLKEVLEKTTESNLRDLFSRVTARSYGTALCMGNIDSTVTLSLVEELNKTLSFAPLPKEEWSDRKIAFVPKGNFRIKHQEPNDNDANSAVIFYFQVPSKGVSYVILELLADILEQKFYNSLRTQQQLGYIVSSGVKYREKVHYLTFTVQSSIVSSDEIARRIEEFLQTAGLLTLEELSEEQLETFKSALVAKKLEPDQRLSQQAGRFWGEILIDSYESEAAETCPGDSCEGAAGPMFDRAAKEAKAIQSIKLSELRSFATSLLHKKGENRRLLVSQISAQHSPENSTGDDKSSANVNSRAKEGEEDGDYWIDILDEKSFLESQIKKGKNT